MPRLRSLLADLQPATRRLLAARAVRSVAQGALVVDLSLSMHALHWSGLEIGLTLMAGGLVAAAFSMLIGVVSDRLQRKPFLLCNEGLTVLCGLGRAVRARRAGVAGGSGAARTARLDIQPEFGIGIFRYDLGCVACDHSVILYCEMGSACCLQPDFRGDRAGRNRELVAAGGCTRGACGPAYAGGGADYRRQCRGPAL